MFEFETIGMIDQVKVLTAKPENPMSVPGTCMIGEKTPKVSSPCMQWRVHTHRLSL